jgi:hypothetical protein
MLINKYSQREIKRYSDIHKHVISKCEYRLSTGTVATHNNRYPGTDTPYMKSHGPRFLNLHTSALIPIVSTMEAEMYTETLDFCCE